MTCVATATAVARFGGFLKEGSWSQREVSRPVAAISLQLGEKYISRVECMCRKKEKKKTGGQADRWTGGQGGQADGFKNVLRYFRLSQKVMGRLKCSFQL